jgi:hypothetical protein
MGTIRALKRPTSMRFLNIELAPNRKSIQTDSK